MTKVVDDSAAARTSGRRSSRLADTLLVVASLMLSVAVAEGVVRYLNGQPLLIFPLPDLIDMAPAKAEQVEQIPLAQGVDRNWFYSDPPALPNRGRPPDGLSAMKTAPVSGLGTSGDTAFAEPTREACGHAFALA